MSAGGAWVNSLRFLSGTPGSHSFTLNKLECSKQAVNALYNSAWDNGIGCWLISSEWFLSTTE